jgi:hypothetical protein
VKDKASQFYRFLVIKYSKTKKNHHHHHHLAAPPEAGMEIIHVLG